MRERPSALEEFMAYIGFMIGGCMAFFGLIAIALSLVHCDIGGLAVSALACILGIVAVAGSLHEMDEQSKRW